jgi:hypothetical protein
VQSSFARGISYFAVLMRAARALAITLLLTLWTIEALPKPALDEEALARPANERLVLAVHESLQLVGLSESPQQIKTALLDGSRWLARTRKALLAPVMPFYEFTGMQQRWALFRTGSRHGHRLQIEGRGQDGSWSVIYRAHGADPYELASSLSFRRIRGIYDGCTKDDASAQYDGFVEWVARKLMAEHRELRGVRVTLERLRLGSRSEAARVLSVQHERVRERSS